MIQCPECGAEYTVQPDICAQCGYHFDDIPDPFAEALRQEQKTLAQQQKQREAYLKLRDEKNAQRQQIVSAAPDAKTGSAPRSNKNTGKKIQQKKSSPAAWIGVFAVIALFVAAIICLLKDSSPMPVPREGTDGYAFYHEQTDSALRFYRDDTAETIMLTEDAYMTDNFSEAYLEKLMQVSPDGKTVYYPKHFVREQERYFCQLACRHLDAPENEYICAEKIWLAYNTSVMSEDYPVTDMLPPYIISGDTLFYFNGDGALCRKQPDQEEEILDRSALRFWQVDGRDGIYFLSAEKAMPSYKIPATSVSDIPSPWMQIGLPETSCKLLCCSETGAPESLPYPTAEYSVEKWYIPYAADNRYFYFESQTDKNISVFLQADLLTQKFCEPLWSSEDEKQMLCAYPDGSFYYASEMNETGVTLNYFNRKQAQSYEIMTDMKAFGCCINEPYVFVFHSSTETDKPPKLYHGSKEIPVTLPETDAAKVSRTYSFNNKYPVLMLTETDTTNAGEEIYSSDWETAQSALDALPKKTYYAKPDGETPVTFTETEPEIPEETEDLSFVPETANPVLCTGHFPSAAQQ